jgi:hypothetical protein
MVCRVIWCVVELGFLGIELCEENGEKMSPKAFVVVSHSRHCSNRRSESDDTKIQSTSSSAFKLGEVWRGSTLKKALEKRRTDCDYRSSSSTRR